MSAHTSDIGVRIFGLGRDRVSRSFGTSERLETCVVKSRDPSVAAPGDDSTLR
jgi:hypothetical protein